MSTLFKPRIILSRRNITNIDVIACLNSLPKKQKLSIIIEALKRMQKEKYIGFKKFSKNTPGNNDHYDKVYEAMGRMYFVLHSLIDDYNKL